MRPTRLLFVNLWQTGRGLARSTSLIVTITALLVLQGFLLPIVAAQNLPDLFRRVSPSVVLVATLDASGTMTGFGSGVVVSSDGLVATNEHVIRYADRLMVRLAVGREVTAVRLVADADRDLAILWISAQDLNFARLGDSDQVQIGESVLAIGFPKGLDHTLTSGIVSGLRDIDGYRYIQTTVAISAGSSGGPLLNMNGDVIGLTVGSFAKAQSLNFALPSNEILPMLRRAQTARREGKTKPSPDRRFGKISNSGGGCG
jgi:serine protease Do